MNMIAPIKHPDVSIVIPCLNEEENVEAIAAAVTEEMASQPFSYELLFIDNASTDRTVPLIKGMIARDGRIKLIVNARNFGQMRSPTHAIFSAHATRAIISLCADFQDPPSLIGPLLDRWQKGAKIVLGVRESEPGDAIKRLARGVGYYVLSQFADYPVIPDATGFGLYDREVVDCLARWNEPEPFFRGMLVESGYRLETISFPRAERAAGQSKNGLFDLAGFMISALTGSSKKLLRLPFTLAALAFAVAFGTGIWALVCAIAGASALVPVCLTGLELQLGLLFGCLGLVGDQVRIISDRTRNTPLVVEKERVNFDVFEP